MRLFSPRKTTLLFVIRDKTKVVNCFNLICSSIALIIHEFWLTSIVIFEQTPLENLEPVLREDIQKVHITYHFVSLSML